MKNRCAIQEIEEKRKTFLDRLKKVETKYLKFQKLEKFSGRGLKRSIQKLIFTPDIYILYKLWKIGIVGTENKTTKLFWGRKIYLNTRDKNGFFLSFGFFTI